MGTPEFAVPSLDILVRHNYNVVGVVTATDKKGGRGNKKILQSAVKQYALAHDISVLQPPNLKNPAFLAELAALKADLQVVVAFRMLPESVWAMPKLGTFNLHGSLLPKYRGAAPINWAIIKGEQETGVTTFFIKHEIDTGDVLFQEKLAIGENETAGEVHDKMMMLGAEVVLKTVQAIESRDYELKMQDNSLATKAPKIFHETCEIDFNQPAVAVHNFIRGLSPYPAAWAMFQENKFKILRTQIVHESHQLTPGALLTDNKSYLKIACSEGVVEVLDLQMHGRKRMKTKDFLNGFNFK